MISIRRLICCENCFFPIKNNIKLNHLSILHKNKCEICENVDILCREIYDQEVINYLENHKVKSLINDLIINSINNSFKNKILQFFKKLLRLK